MNTGERPSVSRNRLLTTVAWRREEGAHYALEGSVFIGGAAVQWLRDGLGIIASAEDVGPLAASVPDAGGVFFVPALAGLGSPYWDPHARGTIVGLTRGSTRAHLARATLEAIAFQSAELLAAMAADSGIALTELRVDGGATANDLLMQIQADLLGVPVVRPRVTETTALGAAYHAGLAVGFWEDEAEIASLWARDRVFEPRIPRDEADARLAQWRRAVERSRDWAAVPDTVSDTVSGTAGYPGLGAQERLPVVAQLLDRLVDVGERLVLRLLHHARQHVGAPAPARAPSGWRRPRSGSAGRTRRPACSAP